DKQKLPHNHKTSLKPHIPLPITPTIYNQPLIKDPFHIPQKQHPKFTPIYIHLFQKNTQYKHTQNQLHQHLILPKSLAPKL
ncbi:hypothetical protein, partial [Staphylococcus aureus]|uniref:hypothetical protein n=1 Tax=Staphylococcus aureus TaxID=1280 RepID=UPI001C92D4E3